MQWIDNNSRDAEMLNRIDLSPLDTALADGDEQLAKRVRRHNRSIAQLTERFGRLSKDREAVAKVDSWFVRDSKAVLAERSRVLAESWDSLVTLRTLLEDRQGALRELENNVSDRISAVRESYDQALNDARKVLRRRHRRYLKAEPVCGPPYVESLAKDDEAVVELHQRLAGLKQILEAIASILYRAKQNSPLTFRQREVYEQLE